MDRAQTRAFFATLIRSYTTYLVITPHLQGILAWEMAEGWRTFNSLPPSPSETEFTDLLSRIVARAQSTGQLNPDLQPAMMLLAIMGLCLTHLRLIPRYQTLIPEWSEGSLDASCEQLVTLVLDGILAQ